MRLKDETILAIGMISMALGILVGRFLHFEYVGFSVTDFVEGLLVGLSLVMNITYLLLKRKRIVA
jgi:inner membrane protein involved in colicin E2 resistance